MGLLKIQCHEFEVLVFYRSDPKDRCGGGYLGRVFPAGHFHGLDFELLRSLGTGEHTVEMDERARSAKGLSPEYATNLERDYANLQFKLFMFSAGVCTLMELNSDACRFAGSHSVEDLLDGLPPDLHPSLSEWCSDPPGGRGDWITVSSDCRTTGTEEEEAEYERQRREQEDASYRGYCKLHEHFHKPGNRPKFLNGGPRCGIAGVDSLGDFPTVPPQ
jgi:hypothetical protein